MSSHIRTFRGQTFQMLIFHARTFLTATQELEFTLGIEYGGPNRNVLLCIEMFNFSTGSLATQNRFRLMPFTF